MKRLMIVCALLIVSAPAFAAAYPLGGVDEQKEFADAMLERQILCKSLPATYVMYYTWRRNKKDVDKTISRLNRKFRSGCRLVARVDSYWRMGVMDTLKFQEHTVRFEMVLIMPPAQGETYYIFIV